MEPQKLTEYERRRLENIKKNEEMLASLKVNSRLNDLSAATKRQRAQTKSYKNSPEKKSKTETPIVIRRSLRARGMPPNASTADGLKDGFDETTLKIPRQAHMMPKKSRPVMGTITISDAYIGTEWDKKLIDKILSVSKKSQLSCIGGVKEETDGGFSDLAVGVSENEGTGCPEMKNKLLGSIDVEKLALEPENVARVVPGRIMSVRFFPTADMTTIVVGNKYGNVGFWNVDAEKEDGDGIYVYQPHSAPVSGISLQPFLLSKMFTSCYDGFIRLMDVEKEVFDLVYSSEYAIFSISQRPDDVRSLYFGEGPGELNIWDERAGKSSFSFKLHEDKINTIDFSSENSNIMATSSTDGTASIWDLRKIDSNKLKSLKTISHKRAVYSAYFSPSGSCLATTSVDDIVGIVSGANYEDISMIYHYNQTGRWISTFRAIWGWDDSYIFIGNMRRGVDVLSSISRNIIATLQSEHMSAIPCRFDAHPYKVGMLAGATSGGQVYIWTLD
ncbi:unnamed protein product [Ilex paraguariensis]|uniref:WD repeat-containing protein 76 n=1 Tax=Ilex paraguariensis TaxID=185542 RepID=A0ABC8UF47_9AQUA